MRNPEDYGKIKTSFTVELSQIDRKMKKLIKFLENGKIFLDKQNLSFIDPYDYSALKKDLKDRKYKEDLANSICDSYGFASVPKRRELFKLPPEEWQDPDLLKFALSFFEGPRDSDANMFGKFEAVNTNPNNLLLQLFNIKPYKYLKIDLLSGPEVEKYYNLAGSKVKVDKYTTILTACQQLTSEQIKTNSVNYADYKADLFSKFIKNEYFSENPEIVDDSRAFADNLSNTANSNVYPDIILKDPLLEDIADRADSAFLKKQKQLIEVRATLLNTPDFNSVDYEINKIKLLFIYLSEKIIALVEDLKADGVNLDYFTPLYSHYDFIKFQFLNSAGIPVREEQGKQELFFRFTYFKDDPAIIQKKYQQPLSKTTTEFVKPAKKYVDTLTRSVQDQFSAILSASETKINPTILSILSDIDFLNEVIEEGPNFICPPMNSSLEELQKSYDKNSLDNLVDAYLIPDPDGIQAITIKDNDQKQPFFNYNNFPKLYFIPFNGFQVVDKELTEQTRKLIVDNKWYYDSPDNNPATDILKNDFYKKLFDNIFMKNGFAGFFGAKTSFLTNPTAIESIINKIISDAEASGKQALETIHKTILARTNLVCLIEEVVACLFPKGIKCRDILKNFRISDIEEILKKFFPESIYPDLYAALEDYTRKQMTAEQIKLKEEIEALEEDIKNNPRSVIIYNLLNSGSNADLVRSLADIEEKKLTRSPTPEKDREEILIERKKLYASLYGDAVEDNTSTLSAINNASDVANKIDGFLDIIEQYVDIEILCDLARLAELFDISFTFNFNWPTFSLPSFYLDFSFSIEDVTIDLLIQTILQLILGLLEELLTCNGISNLVAAAISGDNSGQGLLANVAAAANQMANDRFDLEEFAKTSGVMKNFNKAMDNLAKNLSNSIRASSAISIQNNPNSFIPVSLKDVTNIDVGISGVNIKQENTNRFKFIKPTLPKEITETINRLNKPVQPSKTKDSKYKYDSGKKEIQLRKAAIAVKNRADASIKINKLSKRNKNQNSTSSVITEKQLKDNLISLINEVSLMLEPHELINLLGGTPYEKDIEFIKQYILQNKPEVGLIADNNTLRNLFSYMANISGLDKLKDDMLNASFVRNRKQAAIKASFCGTDSYNPQDITENPFLLTEFTNNDQILSKIDPQESQENKIEQRKRNREKFGSIASDILKSDPSKVKKKMDDMVFKPIIVGKMPDGKKIGFLNDERNRRIDHTLKNINKDYRSVANSFYSCLTYTTSEDVKIDEYKNKKGDSIESFENGKKISKEVESIEDRKPNPEFKYYESNGVQTIGKQDDEPYGRSMNVTKTKLINCGTFTQNYGSIGDNTRVKVIAEPPKEGEITPNIDNASIQISIKGEVASHSDQEKALELAGLFTRGKWEIDYKESAIGQSSINVSSSRGLEINYKNVISKEDVNVNSYAKYVELIMSSINEGLEKTDYDKEKAISYLRNSYQKFISQMFSGLTEKMTEDSLLKKINPLTPEAMNTLLQNPEIPEQLRQALQEDTVLQTQIVVDTALKYINFSPNATKKQKDKKKDPSLFGVEEIKNYINQSFDKRTEDFLNKNSSLTSEQLYQKKLEENIEEGAIFDGYFLSLVRIYCSDVMLKSLFVNRTFNFDKKILQNLILPSYSSKMILQTISDFSKELNIRSLIEGTSQQIDLVYSTFYPNPEEDKFGKDILILKKNYKKIELDRNVLRRYKNDRVNPLVLMNFDRSVQIQKEIACAEQELELIRRELDFLQLRNICLKEMEIMFDKLTHITLSETSETCPDRGSADKILSNLLADSDALMFDVSNDIARLKQEFENKKQLIDLEYQKEFAAIQSLKYLNATYRKQIRLFLNQYQKTVNKEYPLSIDTILQNTENGLSEATKEYLLFQEGILGTTLESGAVLLSIDYVLRTVDDNEQPIYNLTFEEKEEIKNTAENIAAAELAIENEQKRRETQIYVAQMNGTLDVVSNYEKINQISSNGYLEDFRNTVVELVGGEEAFINTLKRKTKSNTRHFVEKYVRIPKVKNIPNNREYSQLKNFQDTYSLYGVVNYHNYVGFINYIKQNYPQLSKKKAFEIFDGDFKLGMRMMHLLDNKDENSFPQPSIVNDTSDVFEYLKNCKNYVVYFGNSVSSARATSDDYFSSEELASFGNRNVKKEYYIDEKSHCVPHISIDSDGNKKISLLNIVPLVKEEISISKMNNTKLEDLEWNSYDNFILNQEISTQNMKLRESLFCPEIMETLSILTNQNVVVGLLGLSSVEMLSDSISASMFDSIKYKIMQKYLISWRIMNGEDLFLIAEFFDQEWILELMTALLNPKIILKASVFILQFYCRMTDPNIPIALAIRNTIKSGINISAGPFAGKLKPPENMPLPVAPFSLALLPMTVFPPPVGIGPPLTIPGMIYLGADLLLLLFDLFKDIEASADNKSLKNLLDPYCVNLKRYRKYGVEG